MAYSINSPSKCDCCGVEIVENEIKVIARDGFYRHGDTSLCQVYLLHKIGLRLALVVNTFRSLESAADKVCDYIDRNIEHD